MEDRRGELLAEVRKFLSASALFQLLFKGVFLVGGTLAAGFGEAYGIQALLIGGLIATGVGGLFTLLWERDVSGLIAEADRAITRSEKSEVEQAETLQKMQALQGELEQQKSAATRQDTSRRERLLAIRQMIETL